MNKLKITSLALTVLIFGFAPLAAQAYFKTLQNLSDITTLNVVPSRYYNVNTLRFRSQRGRTAPSTFATHTTGTYSRYNNAVASEERAANVIRSIFGFANLSQNNQNSRYDNDRLNDSKIKFRGLISHMCFEPSGSEIERCKKRFGPYFNLKESILDGSIYTILVTNNPNISDNIADLYQKIVAQIKEDKDLPKITVAATTNNSRRDRMQDVWDVCKNQTTDHRSAAICYMRQSRLYLDRSLLNENMTFLE